jgi:hypothetical protein
MHLEVAVLLLQGAFSFGFSELAAISTFNLTISFL